MLEGEDDGVGWEDGEVWVQLVKEVEFVCCATDAVGEEEDITLEPRDSDLSMVSVLRLMLVDPDRI